jgi:hypothetical protein
VSVERSSVSGGVGRAAAFDPRPRLVELCAQALNWEEVEPTGSDEVLRAMEYIAERLSLAAADTPLDVISAGGPCGSSSATGA